ncbi:hypothetical protein [Pseudomonas sp. B392_1p]|uniref:hypothetical protein n=1 Tax=Pseudomonas sp. B392_1p TaxID=3457507 RepID=UPI003FD687A2
MAGLQQLNWDSEGVGSKAAALVDLSTVAGNKISNPPWVKFQSAGWVNFPSAPTSLTGQKRPLISWQSTAEKALWKQLLTRSPIFGGMDALLISHKHSFLLALATCCEARAYAAFGYNWLIPRSI